MLIQAINSWKASSSRSTAVARYMRSVSCLAHSGNQKGSSSRRTKRRDSWEMATPGRWRTSSCVSTRLTLCSTKLKFPILVAIKIWALAHLLANGESYSVLLFATILAWAVILRITLKKRIAAGETKLPVFVSAKYDLIAVVIGLAVYAAIVFKLHELVIGVAPLP